MSTPHPRWVAYRVIRRRAPRPPAWVVRGTASGLDVAVFPLIERDAAYVHAAQLNEATRQPSTTHPIHRPIPGCMNNGGQAPTWQREVGA
jgi:hypothetical protein